MDSFVSAGPWAVLAALVIGGMGMQTYWFITKYVEQTNSTMERLLEVSANNGKAVIELQQLAQSLADGIEKKVAYLENQITPVAAKHDQQLDLLKDLKRTLDQNRAP